MNPYDPVHLQVGTRGERVHCQGFCDAWFDACREAYVAFHAKSGALQWCAQDSTTAVCSQLASVAHNGTQLCELAGASATLSALETVCNAVREVQHGMKPAPSSGWASSRLARQGVVSPFSPVSGRHATTVRTRTKRSHARRRASCRRGE